MSFEEVRSRYGHRIEDELQVAAHGSGLMAEMARYHLATGGKRLRALLPLWVCDSLGGETERAFELGLGLELLHNATLVHDDVQDGDVQRRGQPAVWARWGVAQAINLGDALLMLGIERVGRAPDGPRVVGVVARAIYRTTRGQAMELQVLGRRPEAGHPEPSVAWWEEMAAAKTGALFGACFACGAAAAQLDDDQLAAAQRYGERVGVLFQAQDDLLDLVGEKGRERRGCDLAEGKRSLPVVWAVSNAAERDAARLLPIVTTSRDETTAAMVDEGLALLESCGAVAAIARRVNDEARRLRDEPLARLTPGLIDRLLVPIAHALPSP